MAVSTTTCPHCREVVHTHAGYLVRHGLRYHGFYELCAGSGLPVGCFNMDCCG